MDSSLPWIFSYISKNHLLLLATIIALLVSSVLPIVFGNYLGLIVDNIYQLEEVMSLTIILQLVFGIAIFITSVILRVYFGNKVSTNIVQKMRNDLMEILLANNPNFYNNKNTATINSAITTDVELLQNNLGNNLVQICTHIILCLFACFLMLGISPRLFSFVFAFLLLAIGCFLFFFKKIRGYSSDYQELIGSQHKYIKDIFQNFKYIYIHHKEAYVLKNHNKLCQLSSKKYMDYVMASLLLTLCVFTGLLMLAVGIFFFGGKLIQENTISSGNLVSFFYFLFIFFNSISSVAQEFNLFAKLMGTISNIRRLIYSGANDNLEYTHAVNERNYTDVVYLLNNVSFNYIGNADVIKDFSMEILRGEKVCISGKSGAGKSTLLSLLLGYNKPSSGDLFFRGVASKFLSAKEMCKRVAYIPQRIELFDSTIWENICFGDHCFSEEDVIKACKEANIYGLINSLPNGFDTLIGENGVNLSGGQIQRIILARAFLNSPEILIFDEPTSALDMESEEMIRKALNNLPKSCTYIEVSHKKHFYNYFDRVIML